MESWKFISCVKNCLSTKCCYAIKRDASSEVACYNIWISWTKLLKFCLGIYLVKRKMYPVRWGRLWQPKNYEGLGLRSLRKSNKAFLMKLTRSLGSKRESMWVTFDRDKYNCVELLYDFIPNSYNSFFTLESVQWSMCWG